jgi:hypothetical protein
MYATPFRLNVVDLRLGPHFMKLHYVYLPPYNYNNDE